MVVSDLVKRSVCEFVFACYVSDSAYYAWTLDCVGYVFLLDVLSVLRFCEVLLEIVWIVGFLIV